MDGRTYTRHRLILWAQRHHVKDWEDNAATLTADLLAYWENREDRDLLSQAAGLPLQAQTMALQQTLTGKRPPGRRRDQRPYSTPAESVELLLRYPAGAPVTVAAVMAVFGDAYQHGINREPLTREEIADPARWTEMPHLEGLARTYAQHRSRWEHVDLARLCRLLHLLQLRYGTTRFQFTYLWYAVPCSEGDRHRWEAQQVELAALQDGIGFQSLTVQDLVLNLANVLSGLPEHRAYLDRITEKYL